jgi:hypothetical protein
VIGFVLAPVLHEYVVAPDAVRVAELPMHIEGELTVITGNGLTVTVPTVDAEHSDVVPVTVYEVVVVGLTVIEAVVAPVFQA